MHFKYSCLEKLDYFSALAKYENFQLFINVSNSKKILQILQWFMMRLPNSKFTGKCHGSQKECNSAIFLKRQLPQTFCVDNECELNLKSL